MKPTIEEQQAEYIKKLEQEIMRWQEKYQDDCDKQRNLHKELKIDTLKPEVSLMIRAIIAISNPKPSPIVFGDDKRVRISETTVIVYPEKKPNPKLIDILKDIFIANTEKKDGKEKKSGSSRP